MSKFTTTPLFNRMVKFYLEASEFKDPATGNRVLPKIYNNGSSRSTKTWSTIMLLAAFCDHNRETPLYIAAARDTLVDARKFLFKDFKECLAHIGLLGECEITEFPNPKIKLYGSTIEFMGVPEATKESPRMDIGFINEATEILDKRRVTKFLMRCEMLAIFDWNPSYSSHWVFDGEKEQNTLFTRTTYLDNPYLRREVIDTIESSCPWDFSDSKIEKRGDFKVRVWLKPEDERKPNERNIDGNTADRWYWMVYGEGVPCSRDGAVFPNVEWIREFPATGMDEVVLSADFGYTSDNTVLTRVGRARLDAFIEPMVVQPTENPEVCFFAMMPALEREVERRKAEGVGNADELWICCESQDKYMAETFVDSLNMLAASHSKNWNFFKVSKISIAAGVTVMKKFRLHLVQHPRFEIEQQNYVYKQGTSEPDPQSKFCDIWDAARYSFTHYFYWVIS